MLHGLRGMLVRSGTQFQVFYATPDGDRVIPEAEYVEASKGVFVAYQAVGDGPVDVSLDFHAFAGNVDLIWDEPDWGPLLGSLAEFARLIIHDRRGSGENSTPQEYRQSDGWAHGEEVP